MNKYTFAPEAGWIGYRELTALCVGSVVPVINFEGSWISPCPFIYWACLNLATPVFHAPSPGS